MMDEQGTRTAALLEDMGRNLKVVAERVEAFTASLAEMKHDVDRRFDQLDVRFVGMTIEMRDLKTEVGVLGGKVDKLEGKVDKLETFANDAGPRLQRVEAFANDAGPRLQRVEAFANDAGPRLERIETHLALPASSPQRERTRVTPSRPPRRKPMKRN
jgi:hypothetical protein